MADLDPKLFPPDAEIPPSECPICGGEPLARERVCRSCAVEAAAVQGEPEPMVLRAVTGAKATRGSAANSLALSAVVSFVAFVTVVLPMGLMGGSGGKAGHISEEARREAFEHAKRAEVVQIPLAVGIGIAVALSLAAAAGFRRRGVLGGIVMAAATTAGWAGVALGYPAARERGAFLAVALGSVAGAWIVAVVARRLQSKYRAALALFSTKQRTFQALG